MFKRLRHAVVFASAISVVVAVSTPVTAEASTVPGVSADPVELVVVDFSSDVPEVREVTAGNEREAAALERRLEASGDVIVEEKAEYAPLSAGGATPDPWESRQWVLDRFDVPEAWAQGYTGDGVKVAVLDTGAQLDHPDLVNKIDLYADLLGYQTFDSPFHGTAVAGIIGAERGNGQGSGIAPGARLLVGRVCSEQSCPHEAILRGIIWAVANGADIVNMSFGGPSPSQATTAAIVWAQQQGVMFVGAAGNAGCEPNAWWGKNVFCTPEQERTMWPARDPGVILVGVMEKDGRKPSYGSYGRAMDLVGGAGVLTSQYPSVYRDFHGTSAATPTVTGVAALVKQANPSLTGPQVQAVLHATATKPDPPLRHQTWTTCGNQEPRNDADCVDIRDDLVNPRWLSGAGYPNADRAVRLAAAMRDGTIVAAPTVLPAAGSLQVSWDPVPGASAYDVVVDGEVAVAGVTGTSTTVTGLIDTEASYAVQVRPVGGELSAPVLGVPGAVSGFSAPVIQTVNATVDRVNVRLAQPLPPAIEALVLHVDGKGPVRTWAYSSSPPSNWQFSFSYVTDTPETMRVYGVTRDGRTTPMSEPFTLVSAPPEFPTPQPRLVSVGDRSVTIEWDPIPGAPGYVFANLDANNHMFVPPTTTSVTFTNLSNGRVYSWSMVVSPGIFAIPQSRYSKHVIFRPHPPLPAKPENLQVNWTAQGIRVQFDPVPGATTYNLYRDTTAVGTGESNSFIDTIQPGVFRPEKTTTYRVQAVQYYTGFLDQTFVQLGPVSDPVTFTLPDTPPVTVTCGDPDTHGFFCSWETHGEMPPGFIWEARLYHNGSELRSRKWWELSGREWFSAERNTGEFVLKVRGITNFQSFQLDNEGWNLQGPWSTFTYHYTPPAPPPPVTTPPTTPPTTAPPTTVPPTTAPPVRITVPAPPATSTPPAPPSDTTPPVTAPRPRAGLVSGTGPITVDNGQVRRLPINLPAQTVPFTAASSTATGQGAWVADALGRVHTSGDAPHRGDLGRLGITPNKPINGMAPTVTGNGYWMVASDGGIFAFGDARFHGSMGGRPLNQPIVAMAPTPTGNGYWLVASDGGIFAFGDAGFYGSTGSLRLNRPINGMAATPTGRGYWLFADDGGIFAFGDAGFYGSLPGVPAARGLTAVGMIPTPTNRGYWIVTSDNRVWAFGDAA